METEPKLRVLSLFAGIGGFELGLERTGGFETVAQCEIDPFCRRVLAKHWPHVKRYEDVRTLTADTLRRDGIAVDVITGGFPCQDISYAGPGAGLDGERSGLWFELARIASEVRPAYLIVENVSALLGRGLDAVLGTLAALGYDAEWHCIPASALGAPHYRDRFWLVAYALHDGHGAYHRSGKDTGSAGEGEGERNQRERLWRIIGRSGADMAHAERGESGQRHNPDMQRRWSSEAQQAGLGSRHDASDADDAGRLEQWRSLPVRAQLASAQRGGWWGIEPDVGRVADGVPHRVDRLHALGNAVVPQIPELIGRAILESRRAA